MDRGMKSIVVLIVLIVAMGYISYRSEQGRVQAAPNCRQYLDKAIVLAEQAEPFSFERRAAGAKLSIAYSRIAELCTKF